MINSLCRSLAFLNELDECINIIKKLPEGYQRRFGDIRIAFLKKFPFGVFYKIYDSRIAIIAVLHTRKDTEKWLKGR